MEHWWNDIDRAMSMEHWWNDTDREKRVSVPFFSPQISYGKARHRT